ncbi:unnamed protein product [Amoebophrya sp. A25]|nr:unnamed protein product [Amoebophrya sp. A25]|eukprot:GSA25T00000814001.1
MFLLVLPALLQGVAKNRRPAQQSTSVLSLMVLLLRVIFADAGIAPSLWTSSSLPFFCMPASARKWQNAYHESIPAGYQSDENEVDHTRPDDDDGLDDNSKEDKGDASHLTPSFIVSGTGGKSSGTQAAKPEEKADANALLAANRKRAKEVEQELTEVRKQIKDMEPHENDTDASKEAAQLVSEYLPLEEEQLQGELTTLRNEERELQAKLLTNLLAVDSASTPGTSVKIMSPAASVEEFNQPPLRGPHYRIRFVRTPSSTLQQEVEKLDDNLVLGMCRHNYKGFEMEKAMKLPRKHLAGTDSPIIENVDQLRQNFPDTSSSQMFGQEIEPDDYSSTANVRDVTVGRIVSCGGSFFDTLDEMNLKLNSCETWRPRNFDNVEVEKISVEATREKVKSAIADALSRYGRLRFQMECQAQADNTQDRRGESFKTYRFMLIDVEWN